MLLQSSSSPQDPHPGKAYGIVHILLALNIHIVAAAPGDQPSKAATVGKNSPGVQPPAGDFIKRSTLSFPLFRELCAKFHDLPVPLPAQVWGEDLIFPYHPEGDNAL